MTDTVQPAPSVIDRAADLWAPAFLLSWRVVLGLAVTGSAVVGTIWS